MLKTRWALEAKRLHYVFQTEFAIADYSTGCYEYDYTQEQYNNMKQYTARDLIKKKLCANCKILYEKRYPRAVNNRRVYVARQSRRFVIHRSPDKTLQARTCDKPGCTVSGQAYTIAEEEKPHYCILHNPRIQKHAR